MDRSWIRLVEDLTQKGHDSPYLDRLQERLPGRAATAARREAAQRQLELEIAEEMASALGRAEDKINVSLLKLELLGLDLDALETMRADDDYSQQTLDDALDQKLRAFEQERQHAVKALWELQVHREALGFRRNQMLAELYPIPKRRSRAPR